MKCFVVVVVLFCFVFKVTGYTTWGGGKGSFLYSAHVSKSHPSEITKLVSWRRDLPHGECCYDGLGTPELSWE